MRILRDCSGATSAEYAMIVLVCGVGLGAASLMLGANTAQSVSLGAQATYDSNATPGLSGFGGGGTGTASGSSGGTGSDGGQQGGGQSGGGTTGGDTPPADCGTNGNSGKPKKNC